MTSESYLHHHRYSLRAGLSGQRTDATLSLVFHLDSFCFRPNWVDCIAMVLSNLHLWTWNQSGKRNSKHSNYSRGEDWQGSCYLTFTNQEKITWNLGTTLADGNMTSSQNGPKQNPLPLNSIYGFTSIAPFGAKNHLDDLIFIDYMSQDSFKIWIR